MKPFKSAVAKSTKDYPRPCRGSALMGNQEVPGRDDWPKPTGYAPRLAGLVGCATGRKDADGNDTREAGPSATADLDGDIYCMPHHDCIHCDGTGYIGEGECIACLESKP